MDDVRMSKFLSLVLRHKPEVAGLTLDPNGWVDIQILIGAVKKHRGPFTREDLQRIVTENDKQRFVIEGKRIRANQGHSVEVDLQLKPATPPDVLYHGTQTTNVSSIFKNGLLKGKRQHVHLSPDIETATKVATRRSGKVAMISIRPSEMVDQVFFQSANGVWLTDWIDPKYITVTCTNSVRREGSDGNP